MTTKPRGLAETTRRADARRNFAAIIDAATSCLSRDPDASINDIAAAAGVGRVTLYSHFGSRAGLVTEVLKRAIHDSDAALEQVDLGGDTRAALCRLLDATWEVTHRFGALVVAAQAELGEERLRAEHDAPADRVRRLLRRGRKDGSIRKDMPLGWQVITIQGVVHAASGAVHRAEITAEQAPLLIRVTVLGALAPTNKASPAAYG